MKFSLKFHEENKNQSNPMEVLGNPCAAAAFDDRAEGSTQQREGRKTSDQRVVTKENEECDG